MSGIAQLVGGLSPGGGSVPTIGTPQAANPFDLNALLNMGLSPVEQSLVDFLGGEQDVRTRDIYSRLGLGGSTMEAQDLGGNELARLAESAQLIKGDQQLGLAVQQGTAGINTANAANALTAQGQSLTAQNQAFQQSQKNLGNITGGLGSLATAAGNLLQ